MSSFTGASFITVSHTEPYYEAFYGKFLCKAIIITQRDLLPLLTTTTTTTITPLPSFPICVSYPGWLAPCHLSAPPWTPSRQRRWPGVRRPAGGGTLRERRRRSWCAETGNAGSRDWLRRTTIAPGSPCWGAWWCQSAARPGSPSAAVEMMRGREAEHETDRGRETEEAGKSEESMTAVKISHAAAQWLNSQALVAFYLIPELLQHRKH